VVLTTWYLVAPLRKKATPVPERVVSGKNAKTPINTGFSRSGMVYMTISYRLIE
jgi:hypothetical protein